MEIRDFFSHKIHSSQASWANKLVDLAFIFAEFDQKPYDRVKLEKRLSKISPRASSVARDPSKFRDEISAYPAYLGLYKIELINNEWHFVLSDTAKHFLVIEEPNVPAFMLLQMLLFQYPNGMGVAYYTNSDKVRIQANTRDRTLEFIRAGVHLSPLRLICKAIEAVTIIEPQSIFNASISYDEIFALANDHRIYTHSNPPIDIMIEVLLEIRTGIITPPKLYESRFHIIKHTDFIVPDRSSIHLRNPVNSKDKIELEDKFKTILQLDISFLGFDNATNSDEILQPIINGNWGKYFDGVKTLDAETVEILTSEKGLLDEYEESIDEEIITISGQAPLVYEFRKRNQDTNIYNPHIYPSKKIDPEITRIKRQKSNLNHKLILQQLEEHLESKGCDPVESEHIDLFAQIPGDGKYLFEVKSTTEDNLLSQARKGISQLYEYRFRYQAKIGYDTILCLVLTKRPEKIDWLENYICMDRQIAVIWFNEKGMLEYSEQCKTFIQTLL